MKTNILAFAKLLRRKSFSFSLNVAETCPIGCACYWKVFIGPKVSEVSQAAVRDGAPVANRHLTTPVMSSEEMAVFVRARIREGHVSATYVGGEPYVNPSHLAAITPLLQNWIVTSGTTPLRNFPSTHFISVDGVDAKTHDFVRGSEGLFARIIKNLTSARTQFEFFPAYIHLVLNSVNHKQLEDILAYWKENGLVDGVFVSTATTIRGVAAPHMRLTQSQRESIVERLLKAKKGFGNFLCVSTDMIEALHPDATRGMTPDKCGTATFIDSYDGWGNRIPQCILGRDADCEDCGCTITGLTETLFPLSRGLVTRRRLDTLGVLLGWQRSRVLPPTPPPDPQGIYPPAR
jgi:hypothetical protein